MTNEVSYAPIKYVCNGLSVDFAFPWKIFQAENLIVTIQGQEGVLTLELEKDFTVEFDDVGGNVKTNKAWPDGTILVVARNTDDYQSKDFTTSTGFQASEIEKAFDRVSCNLQEMDYNIENFKETFSEQVGEEIDVLENVIEENKQEVLLIQERFEDEVNTKIEQVSEAAGKINELEQAVLDAQGSAELAEQKAEVAEQKVQEATDILEDITEEGQKQITNIKRTGFYMRDDKLYFINSKGEEEEFKSGGGAGAVMFDTKISDHILEGEEAKGWALQGTYVSGALYPDFYSKCLEEYKNSSKSWNGSNVSLVGSVIDNQGVLSGFSSTNYAEMTSYYQGAINSLEFVTCVTIGEIGVQQNIFGQTKTNQATFQLQMLTSGKIELLASSVGSSSWDVGLQSLNAVTTGSTYWIKTTFNNATGYEFYLSENGVDYDLQASNATTTAPKWTEAYQIGNDVAHATNAFKGSIDLKETYIDVNGSRYWTGANTIAQNSNGHKFYPIAEKSAIDSVYNQYGIADFYGIDEENERIFLPRNKYFAIKNPLQTIPVVGNGMTLGMTNGTNNFGTFLANSYGMYGDSNAYGKNVGSGASESRLETKTVGITTDPTKSGIIADTSNVIQQDESKYLYYCVGNYVVNDSKIDAGGVVAQIEQKASIFLDNILPSQSFKKNSSSWSKASYKYIDLEYGADETIYTAPANGYFAIGLKLAASGGNTYLVLIDDSDNQIMRVGCQQETSSTPYHCFILPVAKNQRMLLDHGTNNTVTYFRFVYDKSSESEVQ